MSKHGARPSCRPVLDTPYANSVYLLLYAKSVAFDQMEFIEAPPFTRYFSDFLADAEYRELQSQLAANPELGDVMPGTGGFRKLRWGDPRRGKGRRGGLRIIYYYSLADQQIWLVTLYG
jgi:hypothetical protein